MAEGQFPADPKSRSADTGMGTSATVSVTVVVSGFIVWRVEMMALTMGRGGRVGHSEITCPGEPQYKHKFWVSLLCRSAGVRQVDSTCMDLVLYRYFGTKWNRPTGELFQNECVTSETEDHSSGCLLDTSNTTAITVHHGAGRNVIVIAATSGGLFIIITIIIIIYIIIILFIIKKQRSDKTEDLTVKENDLYSDASQRASVHDEPLSEPDSAHDAPKRFRGKTPESRDTEEIQYATVQHPRKKETKRSEENENQYDNIRVHQPDAAVRRSTVQTMEEPSMIYSSVK
ncbi:uncharacterized protein [Chanodichthys erythropterus]|uniref:uncharacterized protein n=1 Tax=Chanodichthys erythropterus TaxID=933992 RepID=UPI00351E2347